MKRLIIASLILSCFLIIAPQASANSGSEHNSQSQHDDHDSHDFFHDSRNRFNNWWNKFRHHDNHGHNQGRDDDGEETDRCYDGNYDNDEGCEYPVTSAPEFGGMTAPIAFLGSVAAFVVGKQRGLI